MFLYASLLAEKIIFQPPPSSYQDTREIIKLNVEGGAKISAVYLRNPKVRYTILYSHGNAEDIGMLLPILEEIKRMGFSVFAYDYQGYGTSSGTSSEENAFRDVDAAYTYLVNKLDIPPDRIIALGHSLGGAVAVDLACRRELAGLIVESSFVTAYRVMTHVALFPLDRFQNITKMRQVDCPVLVIHGRADEVIPFWHGERLFDEANEPKMALWIDGARHNDIFEVAGSRYRQSLQEFTALIGRAKGSGR